MTMVGLFFKDLFSYFIELTGQVNLYCLQVRLVKTQILPSLYLSLIFGHVTKLNRAFI